VDSLQYLVALGAGVFAAELHQLAREATVEDREAAVEEEVGEQVRLAFRGGALGEVGKQRGQEANRASEAVPRESSSSGA
jgi:hypothetical protein